MDLTMIENRIKAHYRGFRVYFSPETVAPYVRQLSRITKNTGLQEKLLIRLEESESLVRPHLLKHWIDVETKKPEKEKQERQLTDFEDYLNKMRSAMSTKFTVLKSFAAAALVTSWPPEDRDEIKRSLMRYTWAPEEIENAKRIVKEVIKVAGRHNVDIRPYIREAYM